MAARNASTRRGTKAGDGKAPKHEHTVLVLQGGGALGAYQAGVFEGMHEQGFAPDWVTGVSIGAINGALIVGNAPEKRLERLREFWDRVSSTVPGIELSHWDPLRIEVNQLSAATAAASPRRCAPRSRTFCA